jgi:hypothetical protein
VGFFRYGRRQVDKGRQNLSSELPQAPSVDTGGLWFYRRLQMIPVRARLDSNLRSPDL